MRAPLAIFTALGVCVAWCRPASALGPGTLPGVEREVQETLESYEFCRSDDYPLSEAERAYCPLVGSTSRVCPHLPAACGNDKRPELVFVKPAKHTGQKYTDHGEPSGTGKQGKGGGSGESGSGASSGGSGGDGKDASKPGHDEPPPPPPPPEERKIEIPGWLAMLARIVFYLLAAAFVGAIVYWLVKTFIKGRKDAEDAPDAEADAAKVTELVPEAPRGPIETDVDRLLARARAAAQAGDFKAAIEAAYAALLRRLEGDGLVDLHPSRTNGDYVRQLRERPDMKRALRDIATDVERMQFGSEVPNPTLFDSVYRRVLSLVGRAAALALLLLGLGSQASCRDVGPAPHLAVGDAAVPGGAAPLDTRAVFELLKKHDKSVLSHREEELTLEPDLTIVILPDAPVEPKAWRKLMRWVEKDGGKLVVVGHREDLDDDIHVRWAKAVAETPVVPTDPYGYRWPSHELALPRYGRLVLDQTETQRPDIMLARIEGDPASPHTVEPYAVSKSYVSGGRLVAFADDALFKNVALAAGDNASFLVRLFDDLATSNIQVWDRYTSAAAGAGGAGADSPLESLENSKLGPVLLHLAVLVLLYLVYRGVRFGTPRDPRVVSRRAFSDHARAIGLAYARARASRHALGLYTTWAFERLRDRFGRTRHRGMIPLAEAIAQRTNQSPGQVMQVLMEAGAARDEVAPPSSFRHDATPPAPQGPTGPARDFWIMRQLESFLQASNTKGTPPSSHGGGKG